VTDSLIELVLGQHICVQVTMSSKITAKCLWWLH